MVAVQKMSILLLAGLCMVWSAQAQSRYKLHLKGSCSGTDAAGNEYTMPVNNKTVINEFAKRAGVTNFKNLELVYHLDAGENGDAIEVINKKTGELVVTVFPLAFPRTVTGATAKGAIEQRFAYLYNIYQPGVARGSVVVTERASTNKKGQVSRALDGEIQWHQLPDPDRERLFRISTGRFHVSGKPLVFKK
jgi:hypothetical protein